MDNKGREKEENIKVGEHEKGKEKSKGKKTPQVILLSVYIYTKYHAYMHVVL